MEYQDVRTIQDRIDYRFENEDLLHQAFTRKSFAEEKGGCDNEVLEFIGDKVLDFVVVKYLSEEYGSYACDYEGYSEDEANEFDCELDEGNLTEIKAKLVQKYRLASRIDKLGFAEFLYMGKGDCENHVERQDSVKEDLFEAILGAVALDSGWNLDTLCNVVEHMLDPETELNLNDEYENYIGMIQDWACNTKGELPLYHPEPFIHDYYLFGQFIIGENLSNSHLPFVAYPKRMCKLKLPGIDAIFLDAGQTDHEARRGAAKAAYMYLKSHNLLPTIRDEIENPNYDDSISQLEILARRGYFPIPEYEFIETHDDDGNPIWDCKCHIKEIDRATIGRSSSKKDAKKQAAFEMLERVLEEE
ncbi:MAG: hypothetical protein J6Y67_00970 [Lachnospiraceae bacterium]|nr:hypothetical protein [Lachnospiraceae bacterium]